MTGFDESLIHELVRSENYFKDQNEVRKLRSKAIKMAHKYHFNNNEFYHKYFKSKGIGEEISENDFHKLLIPAEVFKSYEPEFPEREPVKFKQWLDYVSTVRLNFTPKATRSLDAFLAQFYKRGLLLGYSSGTSGTLTFLPRDKFTQDILVKSYIAAVEAAVELNKGKDKFVLGIPKKTFLQVGWNGRAVAEAISPGNVFYGFDELSADIVRLRMRGPKGIKDSIMNFLVKKMLPRVERKAIERMINKLLEWKNERVIFLAPPFLLVDTARYAIEKGIDLKLSENSILASTGGFKGRKVTSREEMNKLVEEVFGIPANQYLDLYGMTESNSIMVECLEANKKHVPPWKEIFLFDENMELIEPDGKVTGQYGFIEPSSRSFPGFILTGDRITVDFDGCSEDEKKTPIVESIERLPKVEGRGCSGVLARTVGG